MWASLALTPRIRRQFDRLDDQRKDSASGEWIRTFAIITTDANELVAGIHDGMPFALARWLGDEADPRDLMRPFPAGQMRMWPISTRVNNCGADRTGAGRGVGKRAAARQTPGHELTVLPYGASWISSGKPCAKPRSCESKSLQALRQLSISLAARRAALLFRPKCCPPCHGT